MENKESFRVKNGGCEYAHNLETIDYLEFLKKSSPPIAPVRRFRGRATIGMTAGSVHGQGPVRREYIGHKVQIGNPLV